RSRRHRFQNLPFVDDKILSQERKRYGLADLAKKGKRTLEKLFVCQDRETARSSGFILPGNRDRVKVGADDSGGRGSFFHLGDEADFPVLVPLERAGKIAGRAALL